MEREVGGSCDQEHRVNWVEKETKLLREVERPWMGGGKGGEGMD